MKAIDSDGLRTTLRRVLGLLLQRRTLRKRAIIRRTRRQSLTSASQTLSIGATRPAVASEIGWSRRAPPS